MQQERDCFFTWAGAMRGERHWFGRGSEESRPETVVTSKSADPDKTQELLRADLVHDGKRLVEAVRLINQHVDELPPTPPDPDGRTVITHIMGPYHRPIERLTADQQALDAKIIEAIKARDQLGL
jgi:hypothetical protein